MVLGKDVWGEKAGGECWGAGRVQAREVVGDVIKVEYREKQPLLPPNATNPCVT